MTQFKQTADGAEVALSDGTREKLDLVIVADGLHSETRELIFGEDTCAGHDTKWGAWVTWLDDELGSPYEEYWGSGSFLRLYPARPSLPRWAMPWFPSAARSGCCGIWAR